MRDPMKGQKSPSQKNDQCMINIYTVCAHKTGPTDFHKRKTKRECRRAPVQGPTESFLV